MYPGKHYQPNLKIDNVVKNLIGGLENSCRHVFMDNFYSRFNFSSIWFKRESKQQGCSGKIEKIYQAVLLHRVFRLDKQNSDKVDLFWLFIERYKSCKRCFHMRKGKYGLNKEMGRKC